MKTFTIKDHGTDWTLGLWLSRYEWDGNLAVVLFCCNKDGESEEPYTTLSIHVADVPLADGEFIVNHDIDDSCLAELERLGVVERTGRLAGYGYVRDRPICRLGALGREVADVAPGTTVPPST